MEIGLHNKPILSRDYFGLAPPVTGRRVTFRILHVFAFRDGLISREQVWIDSGAIVAQLTAS